MSENSLDIAGVGEVAKAIPEKAWNQLVSTACETFQKTLAPITELTGGVGRLISAKFDRLVEAEKILAAETVRRALEKIENLKIKPKCNIKANIVSTIIIESSKQTDLGLRQLWANLLAQEFIDGSVHPEVVNILSKISAEDAQTLAEIAEKCESNDYITSFSGSIFGIKNDGEISASISLFGLKATARRRQKFSFSEKFLESLNLIERDENRWFLTSIGEGFIASVSEPQQKDFA